LLAHAALVILTSLGVLLSCGEREPSGLSREEFVQIYVRLIRARIAAAGDSAAYAAARENIFDFAKVSAADMRGFVEAGKERPEELRAAWQAIAAKLDTLYGGVTEPPPGPPEGLSRGAVADTLGSPPARSPQALPDTLSTQGRRQALPNTLSTPARRQALPDTISSPSRR
jgi:hypothetical protein